MGMANFIDHKDSGFKQQLRELEEESERLAKKGYGYWLDNCGDGEWYCAHCLQPECGKRMAKCN